MKHPTLDGNGEFPWDKLIVDEYELIVHIEDDLRTHAFPHKRRCEVCKKMQWGVEDEVCDNCWMKIQQEIG